MFISSTHFTLKYTERVSFILSTSILGSFTWDFEYYKGMDNNNPVFKVDGLLRKNPV